MKGYIYKITDNTNDNVYYGSTVSSLSHRLSQHKSQFKSWKRGEKNYISVFKIIENNDYRFECIEEVDVETMFELKNRERYYIENNECVNIIIPNRTQKEWLQENKEAYTEWKRNWTKEYYIKNKDLIAEKAKKYCEENKDKILERKRIYREENKDKILEKRQERTDDKAKYDKKYCEANKEKIQEYNKITYTCECGMTLTRRKKNRHEQTNRHKKHLGKNI